MRLDAGETFHSPREISERGARGLFTEEHDTPHASAPLAHRPAQVEREEPEAAEGGEGEGDEQDGAHPDPSAAADPPAASLTMKLSTGLPFVLRQDTPPSLSVRA